MRRLVIEEPYSKAALLSRHLAVFALLVALLGFVGVARGLDLMAVIGGSLLIACGAILAALVAFVVIWRSGHKGAGEAFLGLVLSALLLAYPAALAEQTLRLPRLIDFSTDLANPPDFSLSRAALAARSGQTPPSVPLGSRKDQLKAFPQIQPILLDLDAPDAFKSVVKAATAAGWTIVDQRLPGGRTDIAHVDAVANSFIFGFPSDITLRLRPLVGQTRIDIRAVSRFGPYDFGGNPHNIANFEAALTALVDKK